MTIKSNNSQLPLGWKWKKLAEITNIFDCKHYTPTYVSEGIPLIKTNDLVPGFFIFGTTVYVSRKEYETLTDINKPAQGDIVFAREGSFGVASYIKDNREYAIGQRTMIIRCDLSKINPIYLTTYINSPLCQEELLKVSMGTTVKRVNVSDVKELQIAVPPLSEQKRIAAILEKCDRLRRTRRYSLQLGETFLQSVFLEMFGNFLQLNTKNKFKDVLEIPLNNGVFEKNDLYGCGTPVIWVDNLYHTISIDTSKLRRAKLDNKSIQKYEVFEGDLLFTRSSLVREGTGQINIVPKLSERTTFECHTIRARVNKKLVNPYYILGLYRSSYGRNLIMQRANTATMTTIGQEGIEELLCPIPPLPLQEKFAQIVQKHDRFRTQQREAERQAEHLFQTLLHRAFRGELQNSSSNIKH